MSISRERERHRVGGAGIGGKHDLNVTRYSAISRTEIFMALKRFRHVRFLNRNVFIYPTIIFDLPSIRPRKTMNMACIYMSERLPFNVSSPPEKKGAPEIFLCSQFYASTRAHKFWMNATYCDGNYANEFSIDFPFSLFQLWISRRREVKVVERLEIGKCLHH